MTYFTRLLLFLLVAAAAPFHTVRSQVEIDVLGARASYDFRYKTDPGQAEFAKTDLMYLDIGRKATKFYSRYHQRRDSVTNVAAKKGLSAGEISDARRGYKEGTSSVCYRLPDKKLTIVSETFMIYYFIYDEPMQMPQWRIGGGDGEETETIAGYACRRATADFGGREWTVYYTTEIPFNAGPWKLWGLPGLIVKAEDADHFFRFELTGFERRAGDSPIVFTDERSNGEKYKKVDKKAFIKYEKLFFDDFFSFANSVLAMNLTRADGQPLPKAKRDYIPLEK